MNYSMRWITVLVFCMTPWVLQAYTLETVYFRGILSPAQLTPPVEAQASGQATINGQADLVAGRSHMSAIGSIEF